MNGSTRRTTHAAWAAFALLAAGEPASGAVPVIDSISRPVADRSERLEITGTGFGETPGEIRIDGFTAPHSVWSDQTIIAYVPERAGLGPKVLELIADGGTDQASVAVRPRRPAGRARWRFAVEGDYMLHGPGAASADGLVYISDLGGLIYAVDAGGGLRWIVDALRGMEGGGSEGPVAVGADGTAYVAVNPLGEDVELIAISPAGEILWIYNDPGAWSFAAGPNIGPDGNVYAVFHGPGGASVGAISLTPAGAVRWSNSGTPAMFEHGGIGAPIAFGSSSAGGPAERMFVTVDNDSNRQVYAFALSDGEQHWAVPAAINEVFEGQTAVAASPVTGLVYLSESNGWSLQSFSGLDGSRGWRYSPGISVSASNPTLGPDGIAYMTWEAGHLGAVDAGGAELWQYVAPDGSADGSPRVTPDNRYVIMQGFASFEPGWVKGIDPATGTLAWQLDLGTDGDSNLLPGPPVTITDDSRRAYAVVKPSNFPDTALYTYVYSVALSGIEVAAWPARTALAPGEAVRYWLDVESFETADENVELWIDVTPPGGQATTVIGPAPVTLAPGQRFRRRLSQPIAPGTPAGGPYELRVRVGEYPDAPVSSAAFEYWVGP